MKNNENINIKFKKSNTLTVIFSAVILVGIMMVLLKLGFMSVYATKGDEISGITNKRALIVEKNKSLETEIAQLQSISRIEKIAKEKLGMVKAKPAQYIDVK